MDVVAVLVAISALGFSTAVVLVLLMSAVRDDKLSFAVVLKGDDALLYQR
jgi:hypothetical protein